TAELQKALFAEMKGRIKGDDSSVTMKDGAYAYGTSYRLSGQHPRFFRTARDGGDEHILIDGDAEAEGKPYFNIGGGDHSSDHRLLLWGYDCKGLQFYTLRVRDPTCGNDFVDTIPATGGSGQSDGENNGF